MAKVKIINRIRKMTSEELAEFFHYELGSGDCSDCILNNLGKLEYCKCDNGSTRDCIKNIKAYLDSKD